MAEFEDGPALVAAARALRAAGYRRLDAFSPYPVEDLAEALGFERTWVPPLVLAGGVLGALAGYGLQYYANVIAYAYDVAGRPAHSWPAFIPVTFELAILGAALAAVLGMLALNGLPMPYHPTFNVPRFLEASRDAFFVVVEATDPQFDLSATSELLERLGGRHVVVVPQ
jgi:hypothetical protein